MTESRASAERIICEVMYGAPGEPYDTENGRALIMDVLEKRGLSALTDEAVIELASMHRAEHERATRRAVRP